MEYPKRGYLPLSERRPFWYEQGGHYFLCLCSLSLSRKASNAVTKLPKAISKLIIPINIKMISASVISAPPFQRTMYVLYSGTPVNSLGGCHPCHGFHEWILSQRNRNFNNFHFENNENTDLISECHINIMKKIKILKPLIMLDIRTKCPLLALGVFIVIDNCIWLSFMQIHAYFYFYYIIYYGLLIFCCQNVAV